MQFQYLINAFKQKETLHLPGEEAHGRMMPKHRLPASEFLKTAVNYHIGCVMALLFPDDEGMARLILIERTGGNNLHASQIGFPGGKKEESDVDYLSASMRETEEEVGISKEKIKLLTPLSSLYIPPSNFMVFPFLGFITDQPTFKISEHEVERVITPQLSQFLSEEHDQHGEFESSRGYKVNAPYFAIDDVKIWGATAMILSEIAALAKSI
jgi:8-oxo-dGTP pyrophosphatase MutT (NUDIX family)